MPQLTLTGYSMALPQTRVLSQAWPGRVQMPQLGLQQDSPTLHVFGPHKTLSGMVDMPHTSCEHFSPGEVQVPQLALQQTFPAGQSVSPQGTRFSATVSEVAWPPPEPATVSGAPAAAATVGAADSEPPEPAELGSVGPPAAGVVITRAG